MSCYASNVHGPRSCASHPGPVPGLPLPRPSPFPHSQPQPKRNFLSTCMYIRTLIGRSGTPVLAIMMLVLCLCYAHGFHANGYSDDLRVVIECTAIKSRHYTAIIGDIAMRCQPSRSVFITSCSECSTTIVLRVHDDVVRHAFLNAAECCCAHRTPMWVLGSNPRKPPRSAFITSLSKCSAAAVPRVHADVVRHALPNAVSGTPCCRLCLFDECRLGPSLLHQSPNVERLVSPRVHDDVVRHALRNAVECCQRAWATAGISCGWLSSPLPVL